MGESIGNFFSGDGFNTDDQIEGERVAVAAALGEFDKSRAKDSAKEIVSSFWKDSREETEAKLQAMRDEGLDTTQAEAEVEKLRRVNAAIQAQKAAEKAGVEKGSKDEYNNIIGSMYNDERLGEAVSAQSKLFSSSDENFSLAVQSHLLNLQAKYLEAKTPEEKAAIRAEFEEKREKMSSGGYKVLDTLAKYVQVGLGDVAFTDKASAQTREYLEAIEKIKQIDPSFTIEKGSDFDKISNQIMLASLIAPGGIIKNGGKKIVKEGIEEGAELAVKKGLKEGAELTAKYGDDILDAMENAGGHLLEEHVAKTNQELIRRAIKDGLDATTFLNKSIATKAVQEILVQNSDEISQWLIKNSTNRVAIEGAHSFNVGKGVYNGTKQVRYNLTRSRLILLRDTSMKNGYRILTGFPIFK